jgi:hypothetical protein
VIECETADRDMLSALAASVKLPWSATATTVSNSRSSMGGSVEVPGAADRMT